MNRIDGVKDGGDLIFRLPPGQGGVVHSLSCWVDTSGVAATRTLEVQVKGTVDQFDYTSIVQAGSGQAAGVTRQYTMGTTSRDGASSMLSIGEGRVVVDRDGHIRITLLNAQAGDVLYRGVAMVELI